MESSTPAAPAIPAIPAAEPEQKQTIEEQLRAQVAELEAKLREQQSAAAAQHAVKEAQKPASQHVGTFAQNATRASLIASMGNARWHQLSLKERMNAQGEKEPSPIEIEEAKKFFGRNSDGKQANGLAKNNPARYRRLRVIAIETGIL